MLIVLTKPADYTFSHGLGMQSPLQLPGKKADMVRQRACLI